MISVTNRGSDKPVCHGGAKVRYGCPRSITIISNLTHPNVLSIPQETAQDVRRP